MRRYLIFAAIALALLSFPTPASLFKKPASKPGPAAVPTSAAKMIAEPVKSSTLIDQVSTQKERSDLPAKHHGK